ncbi:MAG TPA: nucleotidyltransferase family protein [Terriglobales bacterium]|nr:nucleotidyltransferase family protein [Terriglobales bacterium]
MPSAVLPNTVPQVLPQREYASSFSGDPEFVLLLACCAHDQTRERVQNALRCELDWERLARLADHHGVMPQVYAVLAQVESVLPAALSALRQKYDRSVHQALWLTRELLRILERFENYGIKVLPYKGPALAQILHGNITSRQFADLDILVLPGDLPKVRASLAELGYETGLKLSPPEERAYVAGGYEWVFDLGEQRNLLEIQWRILPRFYAIDFDVERFFKRAVTIGLCGRAVRTLCAEDLMLALCVHAAKHAWTELSWIREIGELSQSRALDWVAVCKEADRLGVCRIVAVSFALANNLFCLEIPKAVQEYVQRDVEVENIVHRVLPLLSQGEEFDPESVCYFRLMMDVRERWQDRARFLSRLALTPSLGEWSAISLPRWLFPLYRAVRFVRLARRWLC